MTEVAIRRAVPEDADALMELASRMADFDLPPWRTPEEITDADGRAMVAAVVADSAGSDVFVAERSGRIDGCLHMVLARDFFGRAHAHISVIAVSAAAEGTGLARRLLAHADDWARTRGLSIVTLNVFAGNARARRFYEKSGFVVEVLKYARTLQRT